jgi:hypothetical protein
MTLTTPRTLPLFCWILDVSQNVFLVEIDDNKTLGHLKEAVVKKNPVTFANLEVDQLELRKVRNFNFDQTTLLTLPQGVHGD